MGIADLIKVAVQTLSACAQVAQRTLWYARGGPPAEQALVHLDDAAEKYLRLRQQQREGVPAQSAESATRGTSQ